MALLGIHILQHAHDDGTHRRQLRGHDVPENIRVEPVIFVAKKIADTANA